MQRQRQRGQAWLDAVGTENEAQETEKYIAELEADIMPIDNLIAFAESGGGAKVFGDNAPGVAAHAKEIKAAGAKYCDCRHAQLWRQFLRRKKICLTHKKEIVDYENEDPK